jgi:hypothetical protein
VAAETASRHIHATIANSSKIGAPGQPPDRDARPGTCPHPRAPGLWAVLSVEVYQLLTDLRGWTPQQYETWLAYVLDRLFPCWRNQSEDRSLWLTMS